MNYVNKISKEILIKLLLNTIYQLITQVTKAR